MASVTTVVPIMPSDGADKSTFRKSHFRRLPMEIIFHLFSLVEIASLFELASVCQLFAKLSADQNLWFEICSRHFHLTRSTRKKCIHKSMDWRTYFIERYTLSKPSTLWFSSCAENCFSNRKALCSPAQRLADSMVWECKSLSKSPPERYSHSANVVGKYVVFIGGEVRSAKRFKDIWLLSTRSLKVRKALIKGKMQPLSRHQACAHGSLLYVFGGFDGKTQFNNLSYFDVDTGVWAAPLVRGDIPKPRSNHACAIVGNRMFLFGGNNQHTSGKYQVLDDFYMLDLTSMIWTKLDDSAVRGTIPCARSGHRFTVFGTNILMFGGGQWDDKTEQWLHKFNDLFIFDTLKMKWRQPKTRGNAEVCTFPSVSRMGYHMVVFGGQSMASNWTTNNLYILDTVTLEWNEVEFAKDSYKPRCRDMASLTLVNNNTAVLFGGNHGGAQNDWNILRINWKVGDFLYRRPTTAPTNANSTGQN